MATAILTLYPCLLDQINTGIIFPTDTIKLALLGDTFAHNEAHTLWGDVADHEISGTGYTAGGLALSGVVLVTDGVIRKIDANTAVFTALMASGVKNGVLYRNDAADATKRYLIGSLVLADTAFDVDGEYRVGWSANGIFQHKVVR